MEVRWSLATGASLAKVFRRRAWVWHKRTGGAPIAPGACRVGIRTVALPLSAQQNAHATGDLHAKARRPLLSHFRRMP
jgi:hypothetical protein